MNLSSSLYVIVASLLLLLVGCDNNNYTKQSQQSTDLRTSIELSSNGEGLAAFLMPDEDDYDNIPQDTNNPITAEKVLLGQMLYHETTQATAGHSDTLSEQWSCAACHHVNAGFKAGIPQGIGEGGEGFGINGEGRLLRAGFDFTEVSTTPDVQGIASPSVLNVAYQDVMLWNGALGNNIDSINRTVTTAFVEGAGPGAILANQFELSGIETQALAGTHVHRLNFDTINDAGHTYETLYKAAYANNEGVIPTGSTVTPSALGAAKAIAAYERTILANQAPFQRWLQGNENSMSPRQIEGALLFFGKAGCADCHTGPALSSALGADEDDIFFNIGFADFDTTHPQIHGTVTADFSDGRGGFTGVEDDKFKFKIPQLYNLINTEVLGHGASFNSVREVIEYKNAAVPQVDRGELDPRFVPLGLSEEEITQLTDFVENGLFDNNLARYVPDALESGACFPVADSMAQDDLDC